MQRSATSPDYPFKLWHRMQTLGRIPEWSEEMAAVSVQAPSRLQSGKTLEESQLKSKVTLATKSQIAPHSIDCVVVAAGIGSRMHADRPKQYLAVGKHAILEWTVCQLLQAPSIRNIVLVLHPQDQWFEQTCLATYEEICSRLVIVTGGKERVDSVLCGLQAVETEWCLVHDAARPFVHVADIEYLIASVIASYGQTQGDLESKEAVIPEQAVENRDLKDTSDSASKLPVTVGGILAVPETDTLKRLAQIPGHTRLTAEQSCFTQHTEDRSLIARAQTPQMFRTQYLCDKISSCLANSQLITDEASVVDGTKEHVLLITGSSFNFKITTPEDLILAQALTEYMQRS